MVVSNAATSPSTRSILDSEESLLDKLWEINVKSGILLLKVKSSEYNFITLSKCSSIALLEVKFHIN